MEVSLFASYITTLVHWWPFRWGAHCVDATSSHLVLVMGVHTATWLTCSLLTLGVLFYKSDHTHFCHHAPYYCTLQMILGMAGAIVSGLWLGPLETCTTPTLPSLYFASCTFSTIWYAGIGLWVIWQTLLPR